MLCVCTNEDEWRGCVFTTLPIGGFIYSMTHPCPLTQKWWVKASTISHFYTHLICNTIYRRCKAFHIMISNGLHNSWVSRQWDSPITHGQPMLADIEDSSIFHGPADIGWWSKKHWSIESSSWFRNHLQTPCTDLTTWMLLVQHRCVSTWCQLDTSYNLLWPLA